MPIAKAVGKHVLKASVDFVSDVIEGKPIRKATFDRISKAIKPQKRKLNKNSRGDKPTDISKKKQQKKKNDVVFQQHNFCQFLFSWQDI